MNIVSASLTDAERRDVARIAFAAARAGGIPAPQWRAWRRASPVRVLFMAIDPQGERERIAKQWSMEVDNAARAE